MRRSILAATLFALGAVSCSTTTVVRTDPDDPTGGDLSGYWNDIDARQVAQAMIRQCLNNAWISNFQVHQMGRRPAIKVMGVWKRTDDRNFNDWFLAKQVERQLLNSGRIRVVAAWGQDGVNAMERRRQLEHADDESAKSHGDEVGADFTLQTIVNSQNDTDGEGQTVRSYLINMELLSVGTNEKVWIGEHRIRKVIEQSSVNP